tara:strand:- start:5688 stop:6275 length:588 start_codon:yes stop_codon:yes gene_type:complete
VTLDLFIEDDFLEPRLHQKAFDYAVHKGNARWGEVDVDPTHPTGLTINPSEDEQIYQKFDQVCREKFISIAGFELVRMYINCFMPYEQPCWHEDIDPNIEGVKAYTVLYYPQLKYHIEDGGWTEFIDGNYIHGSLPLCNRAVMFDGSLTHRAQPFRNHVRFTYALKYEMITDDDKAPKRFIANNGAGKSGMITLL